MQDAPSFSRLLQIGPDGEPEFITLQELKPHQPLNSPCSYYEQSAMPETNCPTSMFHTSGPGHGLLAPSVITMDRHQTVDSTREELVARKRRNSGYTDLDEDTGDETKSVRTTEDNKKHNHSEIEKRRRDKMNTYITELSSMVPMCHAMSRKLDKLTVLRMAVQHLKTIRGAVHSYTEGYYKPTFLSDKELKTLILKAAEGFLFVVDCDRGRILFVSESVSQILNFSPSDLLGQNWFDILHPKDVAKVKEQLSSSDVSPRERLIDAKTMLPVKTDAPPGLSHLCPGARRSFFCRMKCRQPSQVKEEADTTTGCQHHKQQHQPDRKYCVIHCTGYLKSWSPAKVGLQEPEGDDTNNLSCLVAVGRMMPQLPNLSPSSVAHRSPPNTRTIQFVSRHAMDGKFIFVDQRATLVLGFLPQELLGTSMYEYYHHDDVVHLADAHKTALQSPTNERVTTQVYKFKSRDGSYVKLQSEWKSFRNPWTKDVEYLVAKNCVILSEPDLRVVESSAAVHGEASQPRGNYDFFSPPCNGSSGMEQAITLHMEASKIGRQIADAMLDSHVKQFRDPTPDATPDTQHNQLEESLPPNPMPESGAFGITTNPPMAVTVAPDDVIEMIGEPLLPESPIPETDQDANDGNDEAAMAVIMSLLEADAGLGGPVDFSGLPWPLP